MIIELSIDSLSFGGDGIGRHEGQAVFVPLTAPGDQVRCRIVERQRRYLRAEVLELLVAGEGRCTPRCAVFGRCGGCHWQHLGYSSQLDWKDKLFADILRRQLQRNEIPLLPAIGARQVWNYRSRVQFKCHAAGGSMAIGFYRRGSHHVEAIDQCPIAADSVNHTLAWLRQALPEVPRPDRIPRVDVGVGDRGAPRLVVHDLATPGQSPRSALLTACRKQEHSLFLQSGKKGALHSLCSASPPEIMVDEPPLWLGYQPGGFAQVHLEQNRRLVAAALDMVGLEGGERVLDLFCGMGNLSLPLARRAGRVDGVETFAPAIKQARLNARVNGLSNVSFVAADAARFMAGQKQAYDLVVLDPPRAGAREVIAPLLASRPARILYISCDPMTLARDLKLLLSQGYRLTAARVADLFPQTYHMESLTLLERA